MIPGALGLVLVPSLVLAKTETWREQSEKLVGGRELNEITVENRRGVVSLHRSADGDVHITALKITRACDREHSMSYSQQTQVTTDIEGKRLVIRARYPQRQSIRLNFWDLFSGFQMPSVEVRLSVDVPDGMGVEVNSKSGDVVTDGLDGPQALMTASGDISVSGARGPLRAVSASGDISASDIAAARLQTVSGDLDVEHVSAPLVAATTSGGIAVSAAADSLALTSVSGDIRVAAAPRGLVARTTSGDVVARATRGRVRLESSSGSVNVDLESPLHQAEITTTSGNIDVHLARTLGCNLEMRTTNGTLDTAAPLQVRTVSRHLVAGVIGQGGTAVRLRSSSGDIKVRTGAD